MEAEGERLDAVHDALEDASIRKLLESYNEIKGRKSAHVAKSLASFANKIYELMESLDDTRPSVSHPCFDDSLGPPGGSYSTV
jgi:hypothetical protein